MSPGMWQWCCCGGGDQPIAIVWTDSINQIIQIAEYVDNDWRYEEVAPIGTAYTSKPRIVYDHLGKPYIAYQAGYVLYLAYRTGDYGSGYTIVTIGNSYRLVSIAVDTLNNVYVAHQTSGANPSIYIETWDGSSMSQHEIANSQFIYGDFGQGRISYYGSTLSALTYNEAPTPPGYLDAFQLHTFDGLTWTKTNVYPELDGWGTFTPTCIDDNTTIFANGYIRDIRLLIKTGSNIVVSPTLAGLSTDTLYGVYAYKNSDDSYTAYCLRKSGPNYTVQYANYSGGAWATLTDIQNTGSATTSMDMKAKTDGTRYITYSVNSGGPHYLKYASGAWTLEVLAPGLSTSAYMSSIYVPGAIDANYD